MPLGDATGLFGGRLGSEVALRRLRIAHVQRGKHLAHRRLLGKGCSIDPAGPRFVAMGLGVELRPLRLQLPHLRRRVGGPALEFLLRLFGGPQVAA